MYSYIYAYTYEHSMMKTYVGVAIRGGVISYMTESFCKFDKCNVFNYMCSFCI